MTRRGLWLLVVLLLAGAGWAWGNVPPTAIDLELVTVQGTALRVDLRAQDPDLDPFNPGLHPLRFVLLEGPRFGVLVGDPADVRYSEPYDAVVELAYVPAAGFTGMDHFRFAVIDPHDAGAVGTVQIAVVERPLVGVLSGQWTMDASWLLETAELSAFSTRWTGVYRVSVLTLKGIAELRKMLLGGVDKVVLDRVRLQADYRPVGAILTSSLAFDPKAAFPDVFDHLRATLRFNVADIRLEHAFYLTTPVTSSYLTMAARWRPGELGLVNALRLDLSAAGVPSLARNDFGASWQWCDLTLAGNLLFTKEGFQRLTLSISGIAVSEFLPGLLLDAAITYTVDAQVVSGTLTWKPLPIGCVRLYAGIETSGPDGLTVDGMGIYGFRLECSVGGAKLVSATSLHPSKNSVITGQTDYWEVVRLSGTTLGCCGIPGTWEFATYFYASSTQLFGWGMTTAKVEAGVADHITLRFRAVIRSGELGDPKLELSLRSTVRF